MVTVPAVVAEVAVPADVAYVALATVPVTLAPVSELRPAPDPKNVELTLPPLMLPVTVTLDSVPTEVIFGCAAVVTVPAVVAGGHQRQAARHLHGEQHVPADHSS